MRSKSGAPVVSVIERPPNSRRSHNSIRGAPPPIPIGGPGDDPGGGPLTSRADEIVSVSEGCRLRYSPGPNVAQRPRKKASVQSSQKQSYTTIDAARSLKPDGSKFDIVPRSVTRRPPKSAYSNSVISPATAVVVANQPL